MRYYHGTSSHNAAILSRGTVDVTRGGGELGRGFYTGGFLHEAKAWAFHVSDSKQRNVVAFDTEDVEVEALDIEILDHRAASLRRFHIKQKEKTRSYLFGKDMVWAPIVGSDRVSGDQYKWESAKASDLLNGAETARTVL